MKNPVRTEPQRLTKPAALGLGERLRRLRVAAGLTQGELAGDRFSKEYVSQIERGKTRPTTETIEWLAQQLGVDASFLANGVSTDERGRVEGGPRPGRGAVSAPTSRAGARGLRRASLARSSPPAPPELEVRALTGEARARGIEGDVRSAIPLLERARGLAEGASFSDVERAEVVFELGVARYKLSSISTALALFSAALELAERSGFPCDLLRSKILEGRSRCYRRQRDFEAAKEDVERSLELACGVDDRSAMANAYFQASRARRARGSLGARAQVRRAGEVDLRGSRGASARRPAAQQHRRPDVHAREARRGHPAPEGSVPHRPRPRERRRRGAGRVVARAGPSAHRPSRAGRGAVAPRAASCSTAASTSSTRSATPSSSSAARSSSRAGSTTRRSQFRAADASFEQLSSVSHRAAAWVALGDLATRRGDDREAAHVYRRAAEALQDFRF